MEELTVKPVLPVIAKDVIRCGIENAGGEDRLCGGGPARSAGPRK
jgi:hypothetical protein